MNKLFPNLFIIGAMKSGTSSLHEYLHQHPDIFMSRFKEPQYFAPHKTRLGYRWGQGNPCPEPGIDWYLRLFDDAANSTFAGESSVSYTARPAHTDCERRIHEFNPNARLIYIMRDPIERAISHYWHFVTAGQEDRPMLMALKREKEYIARSDYAMQLVPFLELFGKEQVHTLTLEELNDNPQRAFLSIFTWLGVNPNVHIETSHRFNVGKKEIFQTRRYRVFLDTIMRHWRWQRHSARLPKFIPRLMQSITYRRVPKEQVDPQEAIEYLRPILQRKTIELEKLLGRTFPEWKTLSPPNHVNNIELELSQTE